MGQAEWMLVVTIGGLVGVGAMGLNLVASVWNGLAPRPVPLTTWLGVMVLAASVLWMRWDDDETNTIVAAVATADPVCSVSGAPHRVAVYQGGAQLDGNWASSPGCHLWALIQDPRTGTFWVQGPAIVDGAAWRLSLALAASGTAAEQLPYLVSIATVDDETHHGWLEQALTMDGIISMEQPPSFAWLARDLALGAQAAR